MVGDHHDHEAEHTASENEHTPPHGYTDTGSHALPGGLTIASDGLRIETPTTRIDSDTEQEWTYRVRNKDGDVVTEFEETHDQLAHLILIRRDLTHFQHLHPEMDENGMWSVEFNLPNPGVYRAFVDVLVDGQPTTLGIDLFASGPSEYEMRPGSTRETTANGYDIVMTPDNISPNEDTTLELKIQDSNNAVQLEPYLGALGHLVALRDGDLAYLHVHPEETDPEDGIIRFAVRFPTIGRYRLFLQAKPRGKLITASFDVCFENV